MHQRKIFFLKIDYNSLNVIPVLFSKACSINSCRKSFVSNIATRRAHRATTHPPRDLETGSRALSSSDSAEEMMSLSQRDDGEIDDDEDFSSPESMKIPDHKWECEHCTFINKPGIRVCTVCCRTPTKNATPIKIQNCRAKRNSLNRKNENISTKSNKKLEENKKEETNFGKNSKSKSGCRQTPPKLSQEPEEALSETFDKELNMLPKSVINKKGMMRKISFRPGIKFYP